MAFENAKVSLTLTFLFKCEIVVSPLHATMHENFGSLKLPQTGAESDDNTWATSKEKMPKNGERTNGYEIVEDVNVDPKDYCYYASIETYGYEPLNRDGTVHNHFLKQSFGRVINSEGVQISSSLPTGRDYFDELDSESDDLFCRSGRVGNLDEDLYSKEALIDAANKFYRDHDDFYETYDLLPYYGTAKQSSTAKWNDGNFRKAEFAMYSIEPDNYFSATMFMLKNDNSAESLEIPSLSTTIYGSALDQFYKSGDYPWWEVNFHQPVVGTKLEIRFGEYKPTSIVIEIFKDGTPICEEVTEEPTTWGGPQKEFSLREAPFNQNLQHLLEFDKIRIKAQTMDGSVVFLNLERVLVKGGISLSPYLEKFETKKPEPLLDGMVFCDDEIERVRFQTFVCGLGQPEFYYDDSVVSTSFYHGGNFSLSSQS